MFYVLDMVWVVQWSRQGVYILAQNLERHVGRAFLFD